MLLRIYRRELFAVQLALNLLVCSTARAEGVVPTEQVCTPDMAQAAESGVDGVNDWKALYGAFRKYAACDQASIAEGYDDIVIRLLTREWDGGSAATALVKKDGAFGAFILRHITELASRADLDRVKVNAMSRCAADATQFCASIAKASAQ